MSDAPPDPVPGQLDFFHQPPALDLVDDDPEPQPTRPRRTQISELPGTTFEEIFGDAA